MRLTPALVACAVIALPITAYAGPSMSHLVESAFSDLRSTSSPEDQRKSSENQRGYLYGGSYKLRIPGASMAPIVSVKAPRVKAGCNGIDANFGALTFLDGEDLKLLLRKSVAQGTTYAFSLAMNAICGTCLSSMQKLADKVNAMTAGLMDSCENGKALARLAGTGITGMGNGLMDLSDTLQAHKTGIQDAGNGLAGGNKSFISTTTESWATWAEKELPNLSPSMLDTDPYKGQRDKTAADMMEVITQEPALAKAISNNLVHTAVVKNKMSFWFTGNGTPSDEEAQADAALLMGLLGTNITYPYVDVVNSQNNRLSNRQVGGGQWSAFFSGQPITVWDCEHQDTTHPHAKKILDAPSIASIIEESCLFPTATELFDTPFDKHRKQYVEYIDRAVLGLTKPNQEMTQLDREFMAHDPMQSVAILSMSGPAVNHIAEALKSDVSTLVVQGIYLDWADKVLSTMKGTISGMLDKASSAQMEDYIAEAKEEIRHQKQLFITERTAILAQINGITAIQEKVSASITAARLSEAITTLSGT